jgi:hypothetical protein
VPNHDVVIVSVRAVIGEAESAEHVRQRFSVAY